MRIKVVLLAGLLIISGFIIAQDGFRPFGGSGQNGPFHGAYSSGSTQSNPRKNPFNPSQCEHLADMSKFVGPVYSSKSSYSSIISNPFGEQQGYSDNVIRKDAPDDGKPTGSVTPLGDAVAPLLLFLLAYTAYTYKARKRKTTSNPQ